MSRSCHRATFSSRRLRVAAQDPGQARRPARRGSGCACGASPRSPSGWQPNGSSTSRTSVRWRLRISVAKRSSPAPASAIAAQHLGVAVAGDHLGRDLLGSQPERLHDPALDRRRHRGVGADRAGELADRSPSNARSSRRRLRSASKAKPASRRPKVVGSAWTPWVRPTQSVSGCSSARSTSASRYSRAPARIASPASTSCSASAVSSTSEEVSP